MDIQALKSEVYAAAKDGQPAVILDLLSELNTHDHETIVQEVINHHTEDGGQSTTPLIIATKNRRAEVVKVLLEKISC